MSKKFSKGDNLRPVKEKKAMKIRLDSIAGPWGKPEGFSCKRESLKSRETLLCFLLPLLHDVDVRAFMHYTIASGLL